MVSNFWGQAEGQFWSMRPDSRCSGVPRTSTNTIFGCIMKIQMSMVFGPPYNGVQAVNFDLTDFSQILFPLIFFPLSIHLNCKLYFLKLKNIFFRKDYLIFLNSICVWIYVIWKALYMFLLWCRLYFMCIWKALYMLFESIIRVRQHNFLFILHGN